MNDELIRSNSTKIVGSDSGGIEQEFIGQTERRLWVDAKIRGFESFDSTMRVDKDFTETVYAYTGYHVLYSYTGTGYLKGFHVDSDNDKLIVELLVDGVSIWGTVGVKDLKDLKFEIAKGTVKYQNEQIWATDGDDFDASFQYPIRFNTGIEIRVSRDDLNDVKIKKYFVQIVKES